MHWQPRETILFSLMATALRACILASLSMVFSAPLDTCSISLSSVAIFDSDARASTSLLSNSSKMSSCICSQRQRTSTDTLEASCLGSSRLPFSNARCLSNSFSGRLLQEPANTCSLSPPPRKAVKPSWASCSRSLITQVLDASSLHALLLLSYLFSTLSTIPSACMSLRESSSSLVAASRNSSLYSSLCAFSSPSTLACISSSSLSFVVMP
mmetsp:Transcript_30689/g.71561  ORF Transcript_30689/g.71561 Transcript_30689/m.71561 type:complete len:212 (-) Transcript_30689:119-754(-)